MPASPTPATDRVSALLTWCGIAACAAGLVAHRMWRPLPFPRLFEFLVLAALAFVLAWPLQRLTGWPRATALAAAWLLASLVYLGPTPLVAVALLACAAIALGSLLLPGPVALPLGLVLVAGALGWVLALPIHHRAIYAIACIVLVGWRRQAVAEALRAAWTGFDAAARGAPRSAGAAMLLLGLAATAAWLPTMQPDDVGYHLGLPWQLQEHARYAMDARQQVWALAPWAGDVLQGVAQVLAGREARGALNLLWLLVAACSLHGLAGALGGDAARRWWAVAMAASLPLTQHLLAGMQTELPAMALLPLLALLVLRHDAAPPRLLLAGAVVFAGLCALKPMHALVALPLLAWAAWRHRGVLPLRWLPLAALGVVLIGGSSYAQSWALTGNPVLPLLNDWFRSPFFAAVDFNDARWQAGFALDLPWRLTFDTGRYLEAHAGGLGFVLVALAGVWLLALRDARTRGLAVVGSLGLLIPLLPLQYARYLQPALVLLLPCLAVAMPPIRHAATAWWALCALNLAFAPNAEWMLRTGALKRVLSHPGDATPVLQRYAPARLLAQRVRMQGDGHSVLVLPGETSALAELGPRGRSMSWYAPAWERDFVRVEADASGHAWATLLRERGIGQVIADQPGASTAQRSGLALAGARKDACAGNACLWRLPDNPRP